MTRAADRIDPFLQKVGDYWKKCPDWRFGQLLINVLGYSERDPFFLEEDDFIELLDTFFDPKKRAEAEKRMETYVEQHPASNGPHSASESGISDDQLVAARRLLTDLKVDNSMENAEALCKLVKMLK